MNQEQARGIIADIEKLLEKTGTVKVMEVCGTHTVSFFRSGVKSMLPEKLKLISGPGCPVCVTSQGYIDTACDLSRRPDTVIATYGDMIRVPGRGGSLEAHKAQGASVLVVYSARDALAYAEKNPGKKVVWLAVGFETTAPATAAAILEAEKRGIENFFVLCGHKLVVPAMSTLLSSGDVPLHGFLTPGHVSVIIGADAYKPIAEVYGKPCVTAGFEPLQMLQGLKRLVELIAAGKAEIDNVYSMVAPGAGNPVAMKFLFTVFEPGDTDWRAMGTLPASGLVLKPEYARFDALREFGVEFGPDYDPPGCRCGEVIQGKVEPKDCSLFATACTPMQPVGPCMVSSEGTCAAWYKYGRFMDERQRR